MDAGECYLVIESEDMTRKIGCLKLHYVQPLPEDIQQFTKLLHPLFPVLAALFSLFHILHFTFTSQLTFTVSHTGLGLG